MEMQPSSMISKTWNSWETLAQRPTRISLGSMGGAKDFWTKLALSDDGGRGGYEKKAWKVSMEGENYGIKQRMMTPWHTHICHA